MKKKEKSQSTAQNTTRDMMIPKMGMSPIETLSHPDIPNTAVKSQTSLTADLAQGMVTMKAV